MLTNGNKSEDKNLFDLFQATRTDNKKIINFEKVGVSSVFSSAAATKIKQTFQQFMISTATCELRNDTIQTIFNQVYFDHLPYLKYLFYWCFYS